MSNVPRVVEAGRKAYGRHCNDAAIDLFFDISEKIPKAVAAKDYAAVIQYCIGTMPLLEQRVLHERGMAKRYGNPRGEDELTVAVRAISFACRLLPVTGARGQLLNLKEAVGFFPELNMYCEAVQLALDSIDTVEEIRAYLRANPGTKQSKLKKALSYDDGRHLSQLVKDMENLGQLERQKRDSTHELCIVESGEASATEPSDSSLRQQPTKGIPVPKGEKRIRWWKRR